MSFNPLISLARNAKRQRMEMQCDPQWVLDLAAERDQLRAERDNLFAERNQLESELRHRQKLIDDAWHAWEVALKGCEAMRSERDSHQRLCIAEMEKNAKLRAEVAMLRSYESEWERSLNQLRAELEAIRGQRAVTKLQWPAIVDLVNEVLGCKAHQFLCERGSIGHEITGINFNSLARIIDRVQHMYALPPQQPDAVSVLGVNEFVVEILRGALEGGSFDGGDIQEIGVRHGLLFPEHRTERCGEHCECAEYGFPVECFRIARALLSTKNAEEGE